MARKKSKQSQKQSQRQTVIVKVGEVKSKRRARRRRAPRRSGGGESLMAPIPMPVISYQTGYGSFPLIQGSIAPPAPEPFPYKAVAEIKKPVMEDVGVGTHGFVEISPPIGTEEVFRKPVPPERKEIKMMEREDIASIKLGESRFNFEPVREERIEMPKPVGILPSVGLEAEIPFIDEKARESVERMSMSVADIESKLVQPTPSKVSSPKLEEPFKVTVQSDESFRIPIKPTKIPRYREKGLIGIRKKRLEKEAKTGGVPSKAVLIGLYKQTYGKNPPKDILKEELYTEVMKVPSRTVIV